MIAPGAVVGDVDAPLAAGAGGDERAVDVEDGLVEEVGRLLSPDLRRVRSKTSWRASTSSGAKRRQKSPAVVKSGIGSAPRASWKRRSLRRSSMSPRQEPLRGRCRRNSGRGRTRDTAGGPRAGGAARRCPQPGRKRQDRPILP